MIEITTKMQINAPAEEVFSAFTDKDKIGNFWFSHSSEDWAEGKDIVLSYEEFDAKVPVHIESIKAGEKIILTWGQAQDERVVTISFKNGVVEIKEQGFQEYEEMFTNPVLAEVRTFEYEEILENLMGGQRGWTFVLTCLKAYLENGLTSLRLGLLN